MSLGRKTATQLRMWSGVGWRLSHFPTSTSMLQYVEASLLDISAGDHGQFSDQLFAIEILY